MALITEYGWVNNLDDLISWENGLKWLSKAIVSDNDPRDREELKALLDLHLEESFSHPKSSIRGAAVFYALCWKKFLLLERFWDRTDSGEMRRFLNDGLSKLYSNYPTMELDFSIFLDREKVACFRMVQLLVEQKKPDPLVLKRIQSGLLVGRGSAAVASLLIISEMVLLLGMDGNAFRPLLEPFFKKGCYNFREAVFREDWVWGLDFLQLVEPVREIILGYGFQDQLQSSFRGFFFCAPTRFFREAFVYLLRWGFLDILRDYIQQSRDASIISLLGEVSALYLDAEKTDLADSLTKLYAALHADSSDTLVAFFRALGGGEVAADSPLVTYFQRGLFPEQGLKAFLDNPGTLLTYYSNLQLLLEWIPESPPAIRRLRVRLLDMLWEEVTGSGRYLIWREALPIFLSLCTQSRDSLIRTEFFLPLLKEGFLSKASAISREVIRFAEDQPEIIELLCDWAGDEFIQLDLVNALGSDCRDTRFAAFSRIVAIYLRLDIRAPYLVEKLKEFRKQYLSAGGAQQYLPFGADRLLDTVIARARGLR